jgi:hypothetical protein
MDEPSEAVLRFIHAQIDTVPHIEALLLLWDSRPSDFTVGEVAKRIFVSEDAATRVLRDLHQRKLVAPTADSARYAYDGAWDTRGDFMASVATTYRRHLIRVATLIHSKASPAVREFARAFEPKKE